MDKAEMQRIHQMAMVAFQAFLTVQVIADVSPRIAFDSGFAAGYLIGVREGKASAS
jgi:hypothetical protein